MMNEEVIRIGEMPIAVVRKPRLKNWYIHILPPDGRVSISVPKEADPEEIRLYLLQKMPEVKEVQEKMTDRPRQSQRKYVSGESYYIWGRPYMLQVIYHGKISRVKLQGHRLILEVPEGSDEERRAKAIRRWYRRELWRMLEIIRPKVEAKMDVQAASYRIRHMRTLWGSCHREKREICLNLQLAEKPMECLTYILTHELTHLLEANHTHHFYALLERFCPTWRAAERILDDMPLAYMEKGETDERAT